MKRFILTLFLSFCLASDLYAAGAGPAIALGGGGSAADDTAYNATSWNANMDAATKNAIRDKIETLSGGDVVGPGSAGDDNIVTFDNTTGKLVQDSGVDITAIADKINSSLYDATTFLYATSDNTPQPKTPAEVVTILGVTSYTPNIPFTPSIKTADYAVTVANDVGKCFQANKTTADLAFTLGDGTADGQVIYFSAIHTTWGATIAVANGVFIGGAEHTLLTLTTRFTLVGLMWNATYSKWYVFTGAGDVTGTTQ